jgi:acyl carrier protein
VPEEGPREAKMTVSVLLQDKITEAIYRAIDDVNLQLPVSSRLPKTRDTLLFGRENGLDSLGLVNLIVALEKHIEKDFGRVVSLATADAVLEAKSTFCSVHSLGEYVASRLQKGDGIHLQES